MLNLNKNNDSVSNVVRVMATETVMTEAQDWHARAWELIAEDNAEGLKEIVPSKVRVNEKVSFFLTPVL